MILFPFASTFPPVTIGCQSQRILKAGLGEFPGGLEPLHGLGISHFQPGLSQHKGRPYRAIMPFFNRTFQQRFPSSTRFLPLTKLIGKCPFMIVGELRRKFFRQRLSGLIVCSRDKLADGLVLDSGLSWVRRLDPALLDRRRIILTVGTSCQLSS